MALDSLLPVARDEIGPAPRIWVDKPASGLAPLGVAAFDAGAGASRLHMSISRSTQPGTYKASAEMAGKRYPVEIHVEPCVHLSLSPRQLILNGHAGEQLRVELTLANSGNVSCEIGRAHAFGLYDIHGAERGIGAAFRKSESTGQSPMERVVQLVEELAKGHGGLVRVQMDQGAGLIAAGEVRPLRLSLHLPAGLEAGHTYTGILPLENLRYYVKIRATGEAK
jgi:hypothetical protein